METANERHRAVLEALENALQGPTPANPQAVLLRVRDISENATAQTPNAVSMPPSLLVTIGSRAAERILQHEHPAPVLSVFLPDVAYRQLVRQLPPGASGQDRAAIVLDQPLSRQFAIAASLLPEARRAGGLFSEEATAAIAAFRAAAERFGFQPNPELVAPDGEPADSVEALVQDNDVVLAVYDHRVFQPATAKWMLYLGFQERRPIVGFSYALLKAGAVAAVYSTPEQIGLHTAELARAWLAGERPPEVQYPAYFNLAINGPVARDLGIEVPDEAEFRAQVRARLEEPVP